MHLSFEGLTKIVQSEAKQNFSFFSTWFSSQSLCSMVQGNRSFYVMLNKLFEVWGPVSILSSKKASEDRPDCKTENRYQNALCQPFPQPGRFLFISPWHYSCLLRWEHKQGTQCQHFQMKCTSTVTKSILPHNQWEGVPSYENGISAPGRTKTSLHSVLSVPPIQYQFFLWLSNCDKRYWK